MSAPTSLAQGRAEAATKVLLVEDEWLLRTTVKDFLHDCGHAVIEAETGDDAIALLTDGVSVDLVITDIKMPGLVDGVALASWLAQHQPRLPVILASGTLGRHTPEPDLPTVCHRLDKPYRLRELEDAVEKSLKTNVAD